MKVNKGPRLWASLVAVVLASAGRAQTPDTFEEIAARVTTTVPGTGILIDRGKDDGVEVGDRVQFSERGGQAYFGVVIELEGRSAVVRPEDVQFRPGPGVRAVVYVPDARLAAPAPAPAKVPVPAPTSDPNAPADRPAPTWSNPDDEWKIDMPLLAGVRAVPPSERPRRISGRSYLSFDRIVDTEAGRGDVFLRGGGGLLAENPFGRGGVLHFDGEWNLRKAQIPDDNDESDRTFRLDRLSYRSGGHRHDWNSWQVGRFLNVDMPEFGILDGGAWTWRRESGSSFGASVGFLPEPDKDQQSFEDFQLAAWYRWVADEREVLTVTTGFQKTWHNGSRDRDLLVSRLQYVPAEGWNVFSTIWIDIYGVGDDVKTSGPELTYMVLDATRRIGERGGVDFEYRHQAYPELLRNDFPPVGLAQLEDARVDRLSATGWRWLRPRSADRSGLRTYGRVAGWLDEEDSGGDAELGLEFHDIGVRGARLDVAGFTSQGKFSDLIGARVRYGRFTGTRSWSLQYELRQNDIIGFDNDNDDLIQHRVRGTYDFFRTSGFSASLSAEVQLQDREDQLFLGVFLQRTF